MPDPACTICGSARGDVHRYVGDRVNEHSHSMFTDCIAALRSDLSDAVRERDEASKVIDKIRESVATLERRCEKERDEARAVATVYVEELVVVREKLERIESKLRPLAEEWVKSSFISTDDGISRMRRAEGLRSAMRAICDAVLELFPAQPSGKP